MHIYTIKCMEAMLFLTFSKHRPSTKSTIIRQFVKQIRKLADTGFRVSGTEPAGQHPDTLTHVYKSLKKSYQNRNLR